MRKTLLALAGVAALGMFAPTPSFAQFAVDTPAGGVRIGESRHDGWRHDGWRHEGWREHRGFRDRDVRLGGDCRTVTVEREGFTKRIRRCD
jgi:hypothetical protein